jgi:alkylhydroperoxidase/carboxymuconolactone decarboxylase family protein YurZ
VTLAAAAESGRTEGNRGDLAVETPGRKPIMTSPAKADVDDTTRDELFSLSAGDLEVLERGLQARELWQEWSGLDARAFSLCKIAALVSLDAPPASYLFQVANALDAGVTPNEIMGVLRAIAPQVGGLKVVAAAPEIVVALGLSAPEPEGA